METRQVCEFKVSVAIPALNEEHYLPVLLRSLCRQRGVTLDVVVVEARSEDRTVEVVNQVIAANTNPNLGIRLFTVERRNVSYQRNYAVEQTKFETLMFLDADTRLPYRFWIRNAVRKHRHRKTAVCCARYRSLEPSPLANFYYAIFYTFQLIMRWITPYAGGGMLLTTRSLFRRVNGFDPEIPVYEDSNFVKRVSKFGPFEVLGDAIYVSSRRFLRDGFFKSGLLYVKVFLHRTRHGECRHDHGYWLDQNFTAAGLSTPGEYG